MKTCPICHSTCFDDMEICYGCLYSFSQDHALPEKSVTGMPEGSVVIPAADRRDEAIIEEEPPEPDSFEPIVVSGNGWNGQRLELVIDVRGFGTARV